MRCIAAYQFEDAADWLLLPHKNRAGSFLLRSPIHETHISTGHTQISMGIQENLSCILLRVSRCCDDPSVVVQGIPHLLVCRRATVGHAGL